ncbi:YaiO family outer membrane beta-barrel protein [Polynucleobacter sp. AP-Kaivos-20-H2]|uniref:YaiO family outer membrane beta-barrel protein n=1 Tax=Polynucleobacter sp. AP-Kaivos-20-H2 TaxID=2689104 RepID=UPI001C0BE63C|nr:YaiO family outer membrane beta-barrel protein [Polynucleobacter sp. AP-Kaivos-20-H2]MBU3603247.1 YaiO family outer membrane beta-barrel protein [Polynucleobacter sp. AP-Kaivos-20-H2]
MARIPFLLLISAGSALAQNAVNVQIGTAALDELSTGYAGRPAVFDAAPYVEIGSNYDQLTNNYASWSAQYLNLSLPLHENGLVNVQVQNVQRFSMVDQDLNIAYAYPTKLGVINLDGVYSANPNFLPQTSLGLGWNGKLPEGFGYIVAANQKQYSESYANAATNMYSLGLEKYIGEFRFAYVGMVSSINRNQGSFASKVQGQWIGSSENRLGLTYAQGMEPAVVALNNLASIQFQYIQIDSLYWITKTIGVTTALWHGKEGSYYQRNGGQLGLRATF